MRIKRPSPGTVIATVALVMASTGPAVAAITDAETVDGLSAVSASSSNSRAKGNLVATARGGSNPGQIPNKFLADVPESRPFVAAFTVEDNQTGATVALYATPLGGLSASCQDQAAAAGTEDPRLVISFTNSSGTTINVARRAGVGDATIGTLANGTVDSFAINGSNTFRYQLESNGGVLLIDGVVRQDRPSPDNGTCFVYGTAQVIR